MAPSPIAARRFGRKVTLREDWKDIKIDVMRTLVVQKFRQNEIIAKRLLDTRDVLLVEENSWGDTFWGKTNGIGKNWLGQILMQVRAALRVEADNE